MPKEGHERDRVNASRYSCSVFLYFSQNIIREYDTARDSVTNHKNYIFSEKSSVSVYSLRDSDHQKLNKLRFLKFKSELSCGNQSNTRL